MSVKDTFQDETSKIQECIEKTNAIQDSTPGGKITEANALNVFIPLLQQGRVHANHGRVT